MDSDQFVEALYSLRGIGAEPSKRMSDTDARGYVIQAIKSMGLEPTARRVQAVMAVGRFEGRYGSAFGTDVNNWGAMQASHGPPCGDGSVEVKDHHANGTPYQWCYTRWSTPVDGATALAKRLLGRPGILQAVDTGSAYDMAEAMYKTGYYEGRGTPEQAILGYAKTIHSQIVEIAKNTGEPYALSGAAGGGSGARPSGQSINAAGAMTVVLVLSVLGSIVVGRR